MARLKKAVTNLLSSPLHAIVGLDLLATGLMLLTHQRYFFWPPNWETLLKIENNSAVGIVGIAIGIGLIGWSVGFLENTRANQVLLALSAAYLTWLGFNELMHAIFAPLSTPRMIMSGFQDLIMVLLSLYLAKTGPSNRDNE
jgi:hypothetical protein|nr:MAG TPA: hypothetical protein [Caudoviricetes sp.]